LHSAGPLYSAARLRPAALLCLAAAQC
jgi:hypothetical protein